MIHYQTIHKGSTIYPVTTATDFGNWTTDTTYSTDTTVSTDTTYSTDTVSTDDGFWSTHTTSARIARIQICSKVTF